MSRGLLDREVRRAVAALPGVRTLQGHEVTALTGRDGIVTGVRCRVRGAQDNERILAADLVVDASGRGSDAPAWLSTLGFAPVRETVVDAYLGYATRLCRRPEGLNADWKAMLVRSRTATTRAGAIFPIEGGRCLVTLAGFARDYPPQDEDGFLAFVRGIGVPEFCEAVRAAEPLAPTVGYRRTTNRWRRYDEAERWPEGFVAVGDAVCAFNPYYGQGMGVAAMSATVLADLLAGRGAPSGFARAFQRRLARLLATPWLMATTEECRYPGTAGAAFGWRTRLNLWYTDRLLARAARDPAVMRAFMRVSHLVDPFGALIRPRVALPVLFGAAGGEPVVPAPSSATQARWCTGCRP
jgi:2-polyprenyl-6-methoxyphenol hydroxylase-like FAD-dependent oxidoreductase